MEAFRLDTANRRTNVRDCFFFPILLSLRAIVNAIATVGFNFQKIV